jgi:hypothetical protein
MKTATARLDCALVRIGLPNLKLKTSTLHFLVEALVSGYCPAHVCSFVVTAMIMPLASFAVSCVLLAVVRRATPTRSDHPSATMIRTLNIKSNQKYQRT